MIKFYHSYLTKYGSISHIIILNFCVYIIFFFYIPWPFPPVWGVADNTKETTKPMGISLRSSSNDEGPSQRILCVP